MAISVRASPRHDAVDPMLLPLGNPIECHEEVLCLQPIIPPKRSGKRRSLPYSTRRAARRSAETTAVSRPCHTRVRLRFSLKWLPGDLARTVRRRDCSRRSSAGFDRIARPRT